jgi:hypothetical protein
MKICIKRDLSIEIDGKDCLIEIEAEVTNDKICVKKNINDKTCVVEYIKDERVRLK